MNKGEIEESFELNLQFDKNGLLPAIVQEKKSGTILMMAYVNSEAIELSIKTGYATFWSRSRNSLWKKGETSGNMMNIIDILVDCDQDSIIYQVEKSSGGACHTHSKKGDYRESCFYRKINLPENSLFNLEP